jgi:hypothetical protein
MNVVGMSQSLGGGILVPLSLKGISKAFMKGITFSQVYV